MVRVLEGTLAFVECVDDPSYCNRSDDCVTRDIWVAAEEAVTKALKGITIESLVKKRKERGDVTAA